MRNPICSCVLYLSQLGGPTVVTDQVLTDKHLAQRGWSVLPSENQVCVFDGRLMHFVLPGRGFVPNAATACRTTIMIAFWEALTTRPYVPGAPGASQLFPSDSPHAWPALFRQPVGALTLSKSSKEQQHQQKTKNQRKQPQRSADVMRGVTYCPRIWEPVIDEEEEGDNSEGLFLSNDEVARDLDDDGDASFTSPLIPILPYEVCFQGF